MMWNKTNCTQCEQFSTCPQKTRININYCGSQRVRHHDMLEAAKEDCLSRRGLNFLSVRLQRDTVKPLIAA
ncbi:MAG: hypothetical protein A2293_09450 [Elusimicrobia bacterium RIFOXYB2_FULL_49_7]|nr:MAG: hypothetical protein A2293_09450 [Elusimicrobia bacterium RIFOXYB2_FULL_49_7]